MFNCCVWKAPSGVSPVEYMHTKCTSHAHHMYIHYMHTTCTPHVNHMHTTCTPHVNHKHTTCTPQVHHMHTECTQITYTLHAHQIRTCHMGIACTYMYSTGWTCAETHEVSQFIDVLTNMADNTPQLGHIAPVECY